MVTLVEFRDPTSEVAPTTKFKIPSIAEVHWNDRGGRVDTGEVRLFDQGRARDVFEVRGYPSYLLKVQEEK